MDVALRAARTEDTPSLLRQMAEFNAAEGIPWDPARGEPTLRALLARPEWGRVRRIEAGGEPAGYLIFTYNYDLEYGGMDGFITELYVAPPWRGRGVAGAALALLEAELRADGVAAMHLMVRPENETARRLYARAGFAAEAPRLLLGKRLGSE